MTLEQTQKSICILPNHQKVGGPAAFQARLTKGLLEHGWTTTHNPKSGNCHAVLVIAGSRQINLLTWAKNHHIRIVQRLNGMNWTHKKTKTGLRHYLRSEAINLIMSFTRRHLANDIVYQSAFTQGWWNSVFGKIDSPSYVIHNGVDLDKYKPSIGIDPPSDHIRILVIEGHLGGGHERGFHNAVSACQKMIPLLSTSLELVVVGDVPSSLKEQYRSFPWITWKGIVDRIQIPDLCRKSHLYLPCEINAACPNSLIEAMACGTPVVGFDTGSIAELVGEKAGFVVPYGADDQKLEPANSKALADAAVKIINDHSTFRVHARERAERLFNVNKMISGYIKVLEEK